MGGAAPGWYPDYEAPPGHQRYWDGQGWTEQRRETPAGSVPEASRAAKPTATAARWVLASLAALVLVTVVLVLVLHDRDTGPSDASAPGPASTPGPPAGDRTSQTAGSPTSQPQTSEVSGIVDGETFELDDGTRVRLLGIVDSCGEDELGRLLVGREVTLLAKGPDHDEDASLLRYVDRDGVDVGKRLLQKGLASASDEPNPRRAIYRKVDGRSPDRCA